MLYKQKDFGAIHCKGFLQILRIGSPLYGRWGERAGERKY